MPYPILAQNAACNPECRVCHYKDLDYATQLQRKQAWAEQQLHPWIHSLQEIRPAPEENRLGYRSKTWLKAHFHEGTLSFGMFRSVRVGKKWEEEFISWDSCPLHTPAIQAIIPTLRQTLAEKAPEFCKNSLEGIWIGSPHLVIVGKAADFAPIRALDWQKILVPPSNQPWQVWVHQNPQVGRRIFSHHRIEPIFSEARTPNSGHHGAHPIRAFRQVAQSLLTDARSTATSWLKTPHPGLILDLYSGTGDLSLLFPKETDWIGVEFAKEAVQFANDLKPPGRKLHQCFVGGVEQRLQDPRVLGLIREPYSLYLNPPRSGLTAVARVKILELLPTKRPLKIAYLSCSASSLSRDLPELEAAGYRVSLLQPYDFFPQTEHFETLALLEPL